MAKMEQAKAQMALAVAQGGGLALLVGMVLLLGCSAAISAGAADLGYARQLALGACALGGFIGALWAVKRAGRRALPVGLGTGLLFFALLLAVGLVFTGGGLDLGGQLALLVICVCAGGLAGLAGKRRKKRRIS